MRQKKLYIFVEGNDDELFFKRIIQPLFLNHYADVEIFKYAQWKKQKVELFIQSIITLDYDYIFTADIDLLETIAEKKKIIKNRFSNVDPLKIDIVIKEIESWYLAGVSNEKSAVMNIWLPEDTNEITKEDFNDICHRTYRSRIDFMYEILKSYSFDVAVKKNQSFEYFVKNHRLN
jgi:hypothetical protein